MAGQVHTPRATMMRCGRPSIRATFRLFAPIACGMSGPRRGRYEGSCRKGEHQAEWDGEWVCELQVEGGAPCARGFRSRALAVNQRFADALNHGSRSALQILQVDNERIVCGTCFASAASAGSYLERSWAQVRCIRWRAPQLLHEVEMAGSPLCGEQSVVWDRAAWRQHFLSHTPLPPGGRPMCGTAGLRSRSAAGIATSYRRLLPHGQNPPPSSGSLRPVQAGPLEAVLGLRCRHRPRQRHSSQPPRGPPTSHWTPLLGTVRVGATISCLMSVGATRSWARLFPGLRHLGGQRVQKRLQMLQHGDTVLQPTTAARRRLSSGRMVLRRARPPTRMTG